MASGRKRNKLIVIWEHLKRYIENSSIHGIKHLVTHDRHWTERLYWIIVCTLGWLGCGLMISSAIHEYLVNKAAITMDTTYLKWQLHFPAIHFCFTLSGRAKDYGLEISHLDRSKVFRVNRLLAWSTLGYADIKDESITSKHLTRLGEEVGPKCKDIFGTCFWNEYSIDCCKIFMPLRTCGSGCLSFNSIHLHPPINAGITEFIMNHNQREAKLTLYFNQSDYWQTSRLYGQLYVTDRVQMPFIMGSRDTVFSIPVLNSAIIMDIDQIPIQNDKDVELLPMYDRKCRMKTEKTGYNVFKVYDSNGCNIEMQMKRCYEYCGCVSHLYPQSKTYPVCNITQLECILYNRQNITRLDTSTCLPDCEESTFIIYTNSENASSLPSWAIGKLQFNLLPGPFKRYRRYNVHSLLDVVVSAGSVIGLFVGASVLSLVEIPYWLFLRHDNS